MFVSPKHHVDLVSVSTEPGSRVQQAVVFGKTLGTAAAWAAARPVNAAEARTIEKSILAEIEAVGIDVCARRALAQPSGWGCDVQGRAERILAIEDARSGQRQWKVSQRPFAQNRCNWEGKVEKEGSTASGRAWVYLAGRDTLGESEIGGR